jgi:Pretoxin HINT domain
MSIYDMYDTYKVLVDPCKSGAEKAMAVGLFAAGLVGPGAGYGVIGRKIAGAVNGLRKKCSNSFDEATLVQTYEGLKPIVEIKVGDKVLARNELTDEESYQVVTATMFEWHDTTLTVGLWRAEGSEEIITTDEHPFFVVGKGFTPAGKLVLGDVIKLAGERLSVVGNLKRNFKGQPAYNLTVANDHTYFVGQSRALVHNCIVPGMEGKIPWGSWSDYEKVTANGQEYARVGDRLYSEHAVNRMQPGMRRHSSSGNTGGMPEIYQAGAHGDFGRGVAPQYVESAISRVKPVLQQNGNLSYTSGSLQVITNQQGAVVTIITH